MKDLMCCLNGDWLPLENANVNVLTHTLHYGAGAYEGLRSYDGKLFQLEAHTQRLFRSAQLLGLTIPYTPQQMNTWQKEVIQRNHLKEAYLRPLIFLGQGTMSLDIRALPVQVLIAAWPWDALHAHSKGIHLKTVSIRKLAISSTKIKAKAVGHYLNSALAVQEAKLAGADEALLLDQKGFVCEGSGQNLFFVKDQALFTPTLETALDGITRQTVIEIAHRKGLKVTEGDFTLEELKTADEILLCGTATEIVAVRLLDGQDIGNGVYPITTMLQEEYQALVYA